MSSVTHIHRHTEKHIYTLIHIDTCTHLYIQTCRHIHTYMCMMKMYTGTHIHVMYIEAYMNPFSKTYEPAYRIPKLRKERPMGFSRTG